MRNWARKKNQNTEQVLKAQICHYLARQRDCVVRHYPAFRIDHKTGKSYSSPFMPPGTPDLLVTYRQFSLWIEVKRPAQVQLGLSKIDGPRSKKGVLSAHQKFQINLLRSIGAPVLVAYSLDDVCQWIKKIDARIEERVRQLGMPPGSRILPTIEETETDDA